VDTIPILACTLQGDDGVFCDAPVAPESELSVCSDHAIRIFRYCQSLLKSHVPAQVPDSGLLVGDVRKLNLVQSESARNDYVYYLHVGSLIKVGMCRDLYTRLANYPPDTRVLALEYGGRAREVKVLELLADSVAYGNEWFRPTGTVLRHVAAVAAANVVTFPGVKPKQVSFSPDEEFITTNEAAALVGVIPDTIRKWAHRGSLVKSGWRGREATYPRSEVLKFAHRGKFSNRPAA
jgi:hypothetical protein